MNTHMFGRWLVCMAALIAGLASATERTVLDTTISGVTVYPGIARVTRMGSVSVTPGSVSCVLRGLPAWVDPTDIHAHVGPGDQVRLLSVRAEAVSKPGATKKELEAAEEMLAELKRQLEDAKATIAGQLEAIATERAYLDDLMPWYKDRLPEESKTRPITAAELKEVNDYLSQARLALVQKKDELNHGTREVEKMIRDQEKALEELRQKTNVETVEILVDLMATIAGAAQVQISYLVAGATWCPEHIIPRDGVGRSVTVQTQAIVRQATGETWPAVPMTLSTSHPLLYSAAPVLREWAIGGPMKNMSAADAIFPQAMRLDKAYGTRLDTLLKRWRESTSREDDGKAAVERVLVGQSQATRLLRQLSVRGASPEFSAQGPVSCDSDGHATIAVLAQTELPCVSVVRLIPALSPKGFETLNLTNNTEQPLLPGAVAIFREGQLIGRTTVPFAGLGEEVAVSLGRTQTITATRRLDLAATTTTVLSTRTRQTIAYTITVTNTSKADVQAEVLDQLPVSKSKDVTIRLVRTEPRAET
ncbi:MAG: mucoidy inhibitor MuiA family protein, partial [Lentisphaeria bacterium]|nr:mucoidy inhibitor MuiA family protein [Lentisphaeria bacterium]